MFRFALVAGCVIATALAGGYGGQVGGESVASRQQDDYGNYEFKYDIKDGYGNQQGRQEKGSHGQVAGAYYLGEIDGRQRTVEYQADKLGFRASVKTNEPGTQTSEPAFAPYYNSQNGKSVSAGSIQISHGYGQASYGQATYGQALYGQASYGQEYAAAAQSYGQY